MGRTRQLTLFTCLAAHQNASNNASNLAKTQDFFVKICYDKPFLVGDFYTINNQFEYNGQL